MGTAVGWARAGQQGPLHTEGWLPQTQLMLPYRRACLVHQEGIPAHRPARDRPLLLRDSET